MRAQPWKPRPQVPPPARAAEHTSSMCMEIAGWSHSDCPGGECPCPCGLGGHAREV